MICGYRLEREMRTGRDEAPGASEPAAFSVFIHRVQLRVSSWVSEALKQNVAQLNTSNFIIIYYVYNKSTTFPSENSRKWNLSENQKWQIIIFIYGP